MGSLKEKIVNSNANMPYLPTRIPDARRHVAGDFPSEHSKRSQIKLEPLEQRRFRSTESRPISTSNYLTESVERHREMEASRLKDYLKAKESDANKPWDKPGWPGPKKDHNDESLRELETIKQRVETLKRKTSQSMNDLSILPTPSQFEQLNPQPQSSPISPGDSGWLIKMRKNRYLDHTSKLNEPKKYRSMDQLPTEKVGTTDSDQSTGADPLHWQLRKEFHLAKYSERRASYHVEASSYSHSHSNHQQSQHPSHHPPPPSPPPVPEVIQHQSHPPPYQPPTSTVLNKPLSKSQLLYPPGSTENIASEHKPALRPPEKTVYENNPIAPSELNVQVKRVPPQVPPPLPPTVPSDFDYPERLMSPPPTHQPRSILKGYTSQQYYSQTNLSESHQSHQEIHHHSDLNPQQMHPRPSDRRTPTHFEDLSEDEKTRIMHENLQKHRNLRSGPNGPRPAATSFNGPFFRLEQVSPGKPQSQPHQPQYQQHPRSQSVDPSSEPIGNQRLLQQTREISASEIELHNYSRNLEPSVVVWPPISDKERKRPNSVLAKNFNDPDKIDEYQRQKRMEQEAIQRHEEQQMISMSKQIRAMEIQQQRLYEQSHGVTSPVPMMESISPQPHVHYPPPIQHHQPQQYYPPPPPSQPQTYKDPEPTSYPVQVYETRPISALSDQVDQPHQQPTSWKRTYIVERPKDVAKNEILTSEELLEKESYEVDLLKRRETFVEKPEEPPRINRVGKRWQPPPEKPYVWPTLRRAMSVEPNSRPIDFAPGVPPNYDDEEEFKWEPVVNDPGYKKEDKNFTPVSSPPTSPRRGHGVGPLDEPAKRQAKYVIQPSPDGSHRPKAVFRKERHTPSGGFYPHAPNAIKVVKKRAQSVQGLLSPTDNVEIIHQRNYHRLDLEQNGHHGQKLRRSHGGSEVDLRRPTQELPDWEKIYELPPHSSQIVQKDMPRHVDVQRRLSKFEGSIQNLRAASSTQHLDSMQQLHFPMPDYEPPQHQHQRRRTDSSSYRGGPPPPPPPMPQQPREMSRRNSVASTRIDSPSLMIPHQRQSRSDSRGPQQQSMSRAASSIPLSPQPTPQHHHHHHHHHPSQRPTTPGATRARNYIARATAPSPTPYSYDRARAYVPPALPPGYRLADPIPDQRALSPSPNHTRKLIRNVSESVQRLQPSGSTPQTSRAPSRHSHRQSPNPRFL
uniref:ZM domain-containing protein n=1 Tax=Caenorhabditis tropicalis TaxID=1561998 RepID=A0A1I7UJT3_9PELO